jgi:flavodoxin I
MKAWIVYDSVYGNTEKIAKSMGDALGSGASVMRASEADAAKAAGLDLLVVGSPTFGGKTTEGIKAFLDRIPPEALKGKKVAAFDTRSSIKFVKIFGYAADRIASLLIAKGGTLGAPSEGFIVKGKEGPLQSGETVRAAAWIKGMAG